MRKQEKLLAFFVLIFTILFLANVSAQNITLIAGKVYENDFNTPKSGAVVSATCNSNALSTNSLDDGSYALGFTPELCPEDSSVSVSVSLGNLEGSGGGIITECDSGEMCEADLFAIINVILKPKPAQNTGGGGRRGGGGGSLFYLCGNNVCDTGETTTTCPRDCGFENATELTNSNENGQNSETKPLPLNDKTTDKEETLSGFSFITGAVIGALKSPPILIAVLLIAIVIAASFVVRVIRKRAANA